MIDARYTLDKYRQHDKELNSTYFDHFKALVESFEHYGGSIGTDIGLLRELEDDTDPDHPGPLPTGSDADEVRKWIVDNNRYQEKLKKASRNRCLAIMFLKRSDKDRYSDLIASLHNQYTRGTDQYPTDLTNAYNMLNEHVKEYVYKPTKPKNRDEDEVNPGRGYLFFKMDQPSQEQIEKFTMISHVTIVKTKGIIKASVRS